MELRGEMARVRFGVAVMRTDGGFFVSGSARASCGRRYSVRWRSVVAVDVVVGYEFE